MRRRVVCPRSHPASLYVRRPPASFPNGSQCCKPLAAICSGSFRARADGLAVPRTSCRSKFGGLRPPPPQARSAIRPRVAPCSRRAMSVIPRPVVSRSPLLFIAGGRSLVSSQDPVQGLAGVGKHLPGLASLRLGAGAEHLECRHRNLSDELAHLDRSAGGAARHDIPRSSELVGVGCRVLASLVG